MKSHVYEMKIKVSTGDIDFNGHVNNLRYLEWMINSAVEHSESLGLILKLIKKSAPHGLPNHII